MLFTWGSARGTVCSSLPGVSALLERRKGWEVRRSLYLGAPSSPVSGQSSRSEEKDR